MILVIGKGAYLTSFITSTADRINCGEIAALCAGIPAGSCCRKAFSVVDKANPVSIGILDICQITIVEEAGISVVVCHGIGRDTSAGARGDGQL